jgi:transcriptional regulator with XRE-family HTH domain
MSGNGSDTVRKSAVETLALNVIVGRARARLSQSDLAARTGLSRATISNIENTVGDVSLRTIEALANAFGCPVATLLDGADDGLSETDDEINRSRETTSAEEFVDAFDVLTAAAEAADSIRYSNAGRRRMAR